MTNQMNRTAPKCTKAPGGTVPATTPTWTACTTTVITCLSLTTWTGWPGEDSNTPPNAPRWRSGLLTSDDLTTPSTAVAGPNVKVDSRLCSELARLFGYWTFFQGSTTVVVVTPIVVFLLKVWVPQLCVEIPDPEYEYWIVYFLYNCMCKCGRRVFLVFPWLTRKLSRSNARASSTFRRDRVPFFEVYKTFSLSNNNLGRTHGRTVGRTSPGYLFMIELLSGDFPRQGVFAAISVP